MTSQLRRHVGLSVNRDGVIARRDVLKLFTGGAAAGALNWRDGLSLQAADLRRQNRACILLWMQGGPSQFETFDPKPGHANGGETKTIATNVPDIQISENLPNLAKVADRLAIIRSLSTREGEHQRATYLMHTSYLPLASVQFPSLGSVAAHEVAETACELPAFVRIGGGLPLGSNASFLGNQYDAFNVPAAGRVPENTQTGTDATRFRRRLNLLGRLHDATSAEGVARSNDHQTLYDNASRMILSPQMQAFDLESETAATRDAYGRSQFGSACLLARRLVEAGVTFVELGVPGWDTHNDNFNRSRQLCQQFDQPFAYLLTDLAQRGLLDQTLVVWMGEFGRTPRINPNTGRDHYPRSFSAVMAGAGVQVGQVVGATNDAGDTVEDRPVSEKDMFQSIYKALRIDAGKAHMTPIGRPIKFVDGGQPVEELFG